MYRGRKNVSPQVTPTSVDGKDPRSVTMIVVGPEHCIIIAAGDNSRGLVKAGDGDRAKVHGIGKRWLGRPATRKADTEQDHAADGRWKMWASPARRPTRSVASLSSRRPKRERRHALPPLLVHVRVDDGF